MKHRGIHCPIVVFICLGLIIMCFKYETIAIKVILSFNLFNKHTSALVIM